MELKFVVIFLLFLFSIFSSQLHISYYKELYCRLNSIKHNITKYFGNLELYLQAIEKYKEGILYIDKALNTSVLAPENINDTWERACLIIKKMKRTRAEVLTRINSITSSPNFVPDDPPPTYEETISRSGSGSSNTIKTYIDLANALDNLKIESTATLAEIIYSHDNVRLYWISPDGTVIQTSEPQTLNIAVVTDSESSQIVVLEVGNWIYPLIPGVSPCFRTDYGAFILPDVHSDILGASVGIVLPPDADESVYEFLESVLHGVISQEGAEKLISRRRREIEQPTGISGAIFNALTTGAYYISKGLIKGAEKASLAINYGTPKLIDNLAPASEVTSVPPTLQKGIEIASTASGSAAEITGYFADKISSATQALGKYLAPHIQKQGTRLLTSGFNLSEEDASSKVGAILTVAAGAVEGFSTVYQGLETSASILGRSLSDNTVTIVQHKYGASAGHLASNTFSTVGNVISIGHNTRYLTPKGLAKTAAKQTGKAVAVDVLNLPHGSQSNLDSLYPNLNQMQPSTSSIQTTIGSNKQ